jgi:hypothetical protein
MDNIVKYTKKYPANIQIFKEFPGMEYKDPVESQQDSIHNQFTVWQTSYINLDINQILYLQLVSYAEPVHSFSNFIY